MASKEDGTIVRCGVAARARPGESATGDLHLIQRRAGGVLIAVVDGLGHGIEAARSAQAAIRAIEELPSADLQEIVESCHVALRGIRGVVMTLVDFAAQGDRLHYLAVGNVQGMLVRHHPNEQDAEREFFVMRGGVVGHVLPQLRASSLSIATGDDIVLATDGLRIDFTTDRCLDAAPQALAERLLAAYAVESDDALVVTARYIGVSEP